MTPCSAPTRPGRGGRHPVQRPGGAADRRLPRQRAGPDAGHAAGRHQPRLRAGIRAADITDGPGPAGALDRVALPQAAPAPGRRRSRTRTSSAHSPPPSPSARNYRDVHAVPAARGPRTRSGRMEKAILLAIAASLCTATASVCQRLGASSNRTNGFGLLLRLARRPVWLAGWQHDPRVRLSAQRPALRGIGSGPAHSGARAAVRLRLPRRHRLAAGKGETPRLAGCGRNVGGNRPVSLPGVALGRAAARAGFLLVAGGPGHLRGRSGRPGGGLRAG